MCIKHLLRKSDVELFLKTTLYAVTFMIEMIKFTHPSHVNC